MNNYKLTILMPVIDEKESLKETINIILRDNKDYIDKILFLCHKKKN